MTALLLVASFNRTKYLKLSRPERGGFFCVIFTLLFYHKCMDNISKKINEEGSKCEQLPEAIPVNEEKVKEFMKKVQKTINADERDIATAVENDEPNNEEMQKSVQTNTLDSLNYADGKERDEIDEIEAKEKLMGVDVISPFGTSNPKVFKRKLESMGHVRKSTLAEKTGTRVFADEEMQNEALIKAFHEWRGSNWGSTGSKTEAKAKMLASDSVKDFENKLKRKTLSELQEMAMKLGFTPSFDRIRLISALRQEYLKRS